jgi:DNA-binding FrmR family transcriptional regulator
MTSDHEHAHGYTPAKEDYLKRLRRIEGQVRGIARMVDEDNLGHCVVDAARQSPEAGAEKVREAADAIARLVRS